MKIPLFQKEKEKKISISYNSIKDKYVEGDTMVVRPPNYGWLDKKLSNQEMDYLWKCIENKKGSWKSTLAGNITNSYGLTDRGDWFWLNTLLPLCNKYAEEFDNIGNKVPVNQNHPYHLESLWVNYQKQHEFNPTHEHDGLYSFVVWMKIPTQYEDQKKNAIALGVNSNAISNFQFSYNNILGQPQGFTYEMSSGWEGHMIFFPGVLRHQVYPFYNCDETRISISGNIIMNTSKTI